MKHIFIFILVSMVSLATWSQQTITDVLNIDTLNFFQKAQLIEQNNREIFNQSELYEQKRYSRWFSYWTDRVDTLGTFKEYPKIVMDYFHNENKNKSLSFVPEFELVGPFENEMHGGLYSYSTADLKNYTGRASSIIVNPDDSNIVYIGTPFGGIFKTTNALSSNPNDVSWTNVTDNFFCVGVLDMVFDPGDPDIIYAATGNHTNGLIYEWPTINGADYGIGIYKTEDAGATWSQVFGVSPDDMIFLSGITVNKTNGRIYAICKNALYESYDDGITWSDMSMPVPAYANCKDVVIDYSNNRIYAGGSGFLYYKDIYGWHDISSNLPSSGVFSIAYNPVDLDNKNMFALFENHILYKTSNGTTWSQVGTGFSTPFYCITLKISDDGKIYAGGISVQLSINNGLNFFQLSPATGEVIHADVRDIAFANSTNNPAFIATDGGVLRNTTGYFDGWYGITGNLSLSEFYGFSFYKNNPDIVAGGTQDCGTWKRYEDGLWYHIKGSDGGPCVFSLNNPSTFFLKYWVNTHWCKNSNYTSDAYLTTNQIDNPMIHDTYFTNKIYIGNWALNEGTYNASSITWTGFNNFPYDCGQITALDEITTGTNLSDRHVIAAKAMLWDDPTNNCFIHGSLFITHDGGANWISCDNYFENNYGSNFFNKSHISDVKFDPTNANRIWAVFSGFWNTKHVFFSSNGGTTWSNITYDLPNIPTNCIVYDYVNGNLYLGTDFGVYYLPDNTTNWLKFEYSTTGLPSVVVNDLDLVYETGELYVPTFGRGLFKADIYCPYSSTSPLNITSNTEWFLGKKIISDLNIQNGATLTVHGELKVPDDATITIENGSTLIIESDGVLRGACKEYYEGSIIVQAGGSLILNGGKVQMGGDGSITTNYNITAIGSLEFNEGSSIILNDDATKIDIKGNLIIGDNATFSFSGDGYIKLSNTQGYVENITGGSNSSIVLNGNGLDDKVIEIAQTDLLIFGSISSFTLTNAQVYMQNNTSRLAILESNTVINIDNVKFTPLTTSRTSHRGLQVFGQSNCTISDCYFEKGIYGVYGYLTGGSTLQITGSIFSNCQYGVWVHDKSIKLYTCTFTGCNYGLWAEVMSNSDNTIDGCYFTSGTVGIKFSGGTGANLYVNSTMIYSNTSNGIHSVGALTTTLRCSFVYNNGSYGTCIQNSGIINMSEDQTPQGGKSRIFNNSNFCIKFLVASGIYLDNGYNQITKSSGLKIQGTIVESCGNTLNLPARNNQWFTPTNGQPVQGTDYSISRSGCSGQYYLFTPTLPLHYWVDCTGGGQKSEGGGVGELSINSTQDAIENGDYLTAFEQYSNEMTSFSPEMSTITSCEAIWEGMKLCFGNIKLQNPALTTTGSSLFNKMEQGIIKMKQINNLYSKRLYFLNLEHSTLYRLVGDLYTAIQKLNDLIPTLSDDEEIEYAQYWLCICETERDVLAGLIAPQDIESYVNSCDTTNKEKHMIFNNPDAFNSISTNDIVLTVIPNPVTSQSIINVELIDKSSATLEIIDNEGKTIKTFNLTEQKSTINVRSNDLPKGVYTVKVLTSDGLTKTTRMIIQ